MSILILVLIIAFFVVLSFGIKNPFPVVVGLPMLLILAVFMPLNTTDSEQKKLVPPSQVEVARTSTTLYLEHDGMTAKTREVYAYNNWPDTSRVKLYEVGDVNTELKIETFQKPGSSELPQKLQRRRD